MSNENTSVLIAAKSKIFDTQAFLRSVHDIPLKDRVTFRSVIAGMLRDAYGQSVRMIESYFNAHPFDVDPVLCSYSYLCDCIVEISYQIAHDYVHPNECPDRYERLSLIAIGGYGRKEMALFSDIDLLFITPEKVSNRVAQMIETILYILWDMGLKIGHATRSISETINLGKQDHTIKTALLERRFIIGDINLYEDLNEKLHLDLFMQSVSDFVEDKLAERALRHEHQGGQRYMLEPNVKEGKGGLRDLQAMFWMSKYISHTTTYDQMIEQGYFTQSEYDDFENARKFLWATRCHLHLASKRATEKLTFDLQVDVAARFGYCDGNGLRGVEKFMQTYFRHTTLVGALTRVFLTVLESRHIKVTQSFSNKFRNMIWHISETSEKLSDEYILVKGRINLKESDHFIQDPVNILRLFQESLKTGLFIHPDAMRVIVKNLGLITYDIRTSGDVQKIFMSLLLDYGNPERALRHMNELGVLGVIIPEFKRIIALMQFNFYHSYTVDEHIIQCISILAQLESGTLQEELPVASEILKNGVDRRVLYVALLLHDIGKGLPEDHSVAGARLARDIAPELGLNIDETERVIWLIENHLVMSDFAQKRDISDPKTIKDFAKSVKTTARLNVLTVLTVCDIMGVGPGTLNNWKAQLLRDLYKNTKALIQDGIDRLDTNISVEMAQEALRQKIGNYTPKQIEEELNRHYRGYWLGLDVHAHKIFADLFMTIDESFMASHFEIDDNRHATRAQFILKNQSGIFSRLAGALALANASVVDARSYISVDGYTTTVFWLQDSRGNPLDQIKLNRIQDLIDKILAGKIIAKEALKPRNKLKLRERRFRVPTEIVFDNEGSDFYTIIEVDTRDRHSLLYDLTRTLTNCNIQIVNAVVATYGAQAVDVFYVKDLAGLKIRNPVKIKIIKDRLQEAIDLGQKLSRV